MENAEQFRDTEEEFKKYFTNANKLVLKQTYDASLAPAIEGERQDIKPIWQIDAQADEIMLSLKAKYPQKLAGRFGLFGGSTPNAESPSASHKAEETNEETTTYKKTPGS